MKSLNLVLVFCTIFWLSVAAKILVIFPAHSYSHFIIGDVLTKELARRGHEMTVVGTYKPKDTTNNYTFVELPGVKEYNEELVKGFNFYELQCKNGFQTVTIQRKLGYDLTKFIFETENLRNVIKSKDNYDLVIMEHFLNEAIYGLCDLFKAPCMAVCPMGPMNWFNRLTGNIGMASYIPAMLTSYSPRMSFFERLHNLALAVFEEVHLHAYSLPKMEKLMNQHIPATSSLYDLMQNVSMVFLNSHPALSAPVPLTPNMIEIGGIHVDELKNVKLPSDVQSSLDDHSEGVIYFALESNAKSKDMPKETLREIIEGFKKWGKPILCKYEEELPEEMNNIKVAKWFPQTAVLAHKNVVAFITHCGRLSSLESLYYGVPMIGVPIFADQARNAAEMAYYNYAIALDLQTLKARDIHNALIEITANPRYSEEAKFRSKVMQQRNALDEAVYWIEHVLEFKGASYLKNADVNLPWYQFWMVDVIGFVAICFLLFTSIMVYLISIFFNGRSEVNGSNNNISKCKKVN